MAAAQSKIRHQYIEHLRVLHHCWFQVRPQRGSSRPAARNEALLVHTTAVSHSFSKWKVEDYLQDGNLCDADERGQGCVSEDKEPTTTEQQEEAEWMEHGNSTSLPPSPLIMDESFSILSPRHVSLLAHPALVACRFLARLVAVKPPGADRIDVLPSDFFTAKDLFFGAFEANDSV
ncbi:hypothetical protein GW17_00031039 [Ensete ventricosum]|nr:hypothetical protein GW17_00031039 [Ensete ventricosum]